ncbi:MAG: CDP-glycerol glycerophosphotransferase family protein [Oxalobacter sp.]|nr:CDP-glycerol glycerophosphotransferase family protein [Oxalobacter sp.]
MRELSFIEKIFSLVTVFPNTKQLTILGMSWRWEKKHPFAGQPIQKDKVVFWAYSNSFTCSPKYIALKLVELTDKYDVVWVSNRRVVHDSGLEGKIRFVHGIEDSVKELSTARVIVSNERMNYWMHRKFLKRDGQFVINTWHGSLGIKKTGEDRGDVPEDALARAEIDSRAVDLITSNGGYSTDLYKRIFWNHGTVVETGLPRNDIFFKPKRNKVHEYLAVPDDIHFSLYAPTWRETGDITWFDIEPNKVIEALEKRFGGKWLFLSRTHHMMKSKAAVAVKGIDVSSYPDIQEIMAESDVVITDYSSCIYDFVLSKKPGFIYAPDRRLYEDGRGLYYPLSETPFPIAENMDQFVHAIMDFDDDVYQRKVTEFLKGKNCREDGHASEKIAEFIIDVMKNQDDFNRDIEIISAEEYC